MFEFKFLGLVATFLFLFGCAGGSKHHHLLTAVDMPANVDANQRYQAQTIAIRQVRLPEYLNEYNIIYQTSDQQVTVDTNQLWAQDLSDNVKRVIQQNISLQLPSASLYSYPLGANLRPDKIIDVQIIELIANQQSKTLKMVANWQVVEPKERNPLSHEFSQMYALDDPSIVGIVSSYQHALADLSVAIIPTI